MKILIINGPNLNLLGQREPNIYGNRTFREYLCELGAAYPDHEFEYFQSNHEGMLIDRLHSARFSAIDTERADAVVLNAGAFTHYAYALADAIRAIKPLPVVEVHISNVAAREEFRHKSVIAPECVGSIIGFGLDSYRLAIEALTR